MATNDQEFEFFAGERVTLRFPITDTDNVVPTTPKNLTGLDLFWAMVPQDDAGSFATTPLTVEKKSTVGPTEIDVEDFNGTQDRVLVELFNADTVGLTPGVYYFELEAQDGSQEPNTLATGTLILKANLVNT